MCPLVTSRTLLTVSFVVMVTMMGILDGLSFTNVNNVQRINSFKGNNEDEHFMQRTIISLPSLPASNTYFEDEEPSRRFLKYEDTSAQREDDLNILNNDAQTRSSFSEEEIHDLEHKIRGLYSLLTGGLEVLHGAKKSLADPAQIRNSNQGMLQQRTAQGNGWPKENNEKRSFDFIESRPVCPSRTTWSRLEYAKDQNDTLVKVIQPPAGVQNGSQWFQTVSCDMQSVRSSLPADCPNCCLGIDRTSYNSECVTRKILVRALVQEIPPSNSNIRMESQWRWIYVDGSCSCYISNA